jgi:enamine deaminase RidA (YjgF/YER057c/UK114 family)
MAVELRNRPATLAPPPGYSHVAVARGGTMVFTAGAVPLDAEGNLVGEGDALTQAELVIDNLLVALATGSARPGDVAKTTVYVAGPGHETQSAVWQVVRSSGIGRRARSSACRPSAIGGSSSRSRPSPSSSDHAVFRVTQCHT